MASYWIFQANPSTFFKVDKYLSEYVQKTKNDIDEWTVGKAYKDKAKRGDVVFIWKAKGRSDKAGIYAVAMICESAVWKGYTDAEIEPFKPYFVPGTLGRNKNPDWRVIIRYVINMVHRPLPEDKLWAKRLDVNSWVHPGIVELRRRMSYARCSIYSVKDQEGKTIKKLLSEHWSSI